VLATGKNDVPRFGGGLYSSESGESDARCVKMGGRKCWNDHYKGQLLTDIRGALQGAGLDGKQVQSISDQIYGNSRIKDLIEFSRSIHAEMDALLSVARQGGGKLEGATLYSTTFPCHSCARHIVTAGIHTVFYIEPYEKSLAGELHGDSISLDPEPTPKKDRTQDKVDFIHFEGVAPRQYINMFLPKGERKQDGIAINVVSGMGRKVIPEYLDDYRAFESKVVAHLEGLVRT
jgi:deoxycytidylate deaminase